jgi:hypothetical protein
VAGASNKFRRLGKAVLKVRQEGGKHWKYRERDDHKPLRFMQCGKRCTRSPLDARRFPC